MNKRFFFYTRDGWTRQRVADLLVDKDLYSVVPYYDAPHITSYVHRMSFMDEKGRCMSNHTFHDCLYFVVVDESMLCDLSMTIVIKAVDSESCVG